MNILLLSAGKGTRLRPLTDNTPKCLLPVFNKPILAYWIDQALKIDGAEIFINVSHLHNQVTEFIQRIYANNPRIKILFEAELLGTARTLIELFKQFPRETLAVHVDNYSEIDLKQFVNEFMLRIPRRPLVATFKTTNTSASGMVDINLEGTMISYHHKPLKTSLKLANAGIFLLPIWCIEEIRDSGASLIDLSQDVLPMLVNRAQTYFINGIHIDIGTDLETYSSIEKKIVNLGTIK